MVSGQQNVGGDSIQLLHGLIMDFDAGEIRVGEQGRLDVRVGRVTIVRMELRTAWKLSSGRPTQLRLIVVDKSTIHTAMAGNAFL